MIGVNLCCWHHFSDTVFARLVVVLTCQRLHFFSLEIVHPLIPETMATDCAHEADCVNIARDRGCDVTPEESLCRDLIGY